MKSQVILYYLFKLAVLVAVWILGFFVWNTGFDFSAISASLSSAAQSVTTSQTNPNNQSLGTGGSGTATTGQGAGQQVAASAAGAPTINLPSSNVETGVFALSGSGQPGSQIEITANGNVVGTTTVGEDDQWAVEANLTEPGDYQLAARAIDTNGATLAESEPVSVRVKRKIQKIMPTINLPDGSVEPGQVSLTGTGQPKGKTAVVVNGQMVGVVDVADDGTWAYTVDFPEPGDYQLGVRSLDENSVVLSESEPVMVQVSGGTAATGNTTISLPAGGNIQANGNVLSGTGEPGQQVEIIVDGQVVGTAIVGEDGRWEYVADFGESGDYQLSARTLDSNGQVVAESEPVSMQVSGGATASAGTAPAFNLPSGDVQAGEVDLAGTGEPGSQIEIVVNGQVVGTAVVGKDGRWAYTAELAEPGDYQLALRALGDGGPVESEPVELKIIPGRPIVPTINQPAENAAAGVVVLSGTGEPNSRIAVLVDGEVIGTTTTGSNGVWRLRPIIAEPGDYELIARVVGEDSAEEVVSQPVQLALTAPQPTPTPEPLPADATPEPEIDQTYIVQAEDWLSKIADKFYGNPQAYPAIFDATNEKAAEDDSFELIEDPNLIYVGQKLWIPAVDTISVP